MIDLSDGLLADLGHLLKASGCGAVVEEPRLPLSPAFVAAAHNDPSLRRLAWCGGEDYELLFTAPAAFAADIDRAAATSGVAVCPIGQITAAAAGLRLLGDDGQPVPVEAGGYDHFASGD